MRPKTAKTVAKHGVDFQVATLVFDDPNHLREQDRFVNGEKRWQTTGLVKELLLVCCHTWPQEDLMRIISARKASCKERTRYYGYRPL
jgi:uncharacterized DUF497 family protein